VRFRAATQLKSLYRTNFYSDVSKQTKRRDRAQADYQTNIDAKLEIEATSKLNSIDKLDKIIILLQQLDDIKRIKTVDIVTLIRS
jgi:hypothetical protein